MENQEQQVPNQTLPLSYAIVRDRDPDPVERARPEPRSFHLTLRSWDRRACRTRDNRTFTFAITCPTPLWHTMRRPVFKLTRFLMTRGGISPSLVSMTWFPIQTLFRVTITNVSDQYSATRPATISTIVRVASNFGPNDPEQYFVSTLPLPTAVQPYTGQIRYTFYVMNDDARPGFTENGVVPFGFATADPFFSRNEFNIPNNGFWYKITAVRNVVDRTVTTFRFDFLRRVVGMYVNITGFTIELMNDEPISDMMVQVHSHQFLKANSFSSQRMGLSDVLMCAPSPVAVGEGNPPVEDGGTVGDVGVMQTACLPSEVQVSFSSEASENLSMNENFLLDMEVWDSASASLT